MAGIMIPVEVVDKTSQGVGKVEQSLSLLDRSAKNLGRSVSEVQKKFREGGLGNMEIKGAIDETREYIRMQKKLKDELVRMTHANKSAAGSNQYREQLFEVNRILKEQEKELDALENALNRKDSATQKDSQHTSANKNATASLRREYMLLQRELQGLYAAGKANTAEADRLKAKIAQVGTAVNAARTEITALTTGATQINGIISGVQILTGTMSALTGTIGMFTDDEEKLIRIQTKLQSSMTILMGLAQVSNSLYATSAFRITTVNTATQLWHSWNLKTATSLVRLGASATAARAATIALHSAMLGFGGAAILGAIAVAKKFINAHKEQKEAAELAAKAEKEYADSVGQNTGSVLECYSRLSLEYGRLKSTTQKNAWIKDNQNEFNKLGVAVGSVTDAESVFVKNTETMIRAFQLRAEAAAYQQKATEAYAALISRKEMLDAKRVQAGEIAKITSSKKDANSNTYNDGKYELGRDGNYRYTKKGADAHNSNLTKHDPEYQKALERANKYVSEEVKLSEQAKKLLGGIVKTSTTAVSVAETSAATLLQIEKTANDKLFNLDKSKTDDKLKLIEMEREHTIRLLDEELKEKRRVFQEKGWTDDIPKLEALYAKMSDIANKEAEIKKEALNSAAEKQYNEDMIEYLESYGTLKEKEYAIARKWDTKIEEAENEYQKKIYGEKKREELEELASSIEALKNKYGDLYAIMFADAEDLTKNNLSKAIDALSEALKDPALSPTEIDKLTSQLNKLRKAQAISESWGFGTLVEGFKNTKSDDTETRMKGLQQIRTGAQQIQKLFSELGNSLESFRTGLGDWGDVVADLGGSLIALTENTENIVTAFTSENTGEVISAGISSTVKLIDMVGSTISRNRKAQEEWNETVRQCAHEYAMLQIEAMEYKEANIFGVENPYARAIASAREYSLSMKELYKLQDDLMEGQVQVGQKKAIDWSNVGKGTAAGAGMGAAIGSIIPGLGTAIGSAIGSVVGGITGMLSTKTVPVFEKLTEQYGKLWDENYVLNQQMLADYDKLDDSTKKLIDNWEEIRNKAMEAESAMRENFSELAGNLGDELSDALVDAFTNGDIYAALDTFHDAVTGTIEKIMERMVFNQYFQDLFNDLERDMGASFGEGGDESIVDDIMRFTNSYGDRLEDYKNAMMQVQAAMAEQGYDMWGANRAASSLGIATASQDSVNELNGRATAIQGHTFQMNENLKIITATCSEILYHVMGIHTDTTDMRRSLTSIENGMSSLKTQMETITTKGVRMLN